MIFRTIRTLLVMALAVVLTTAIAAFAHTDTDSESEQRFVQIQAKDKFQRSAIANAGVSIEAVRSDSIWGFANERSLKQLRKQGFKVLGNFEKTVGRGGHDNDFGAKGFPSRDEKFHDYAEMTQLLETLARDYSDIVKLQSIGKTIENRDIFAMHINTDSQALASSQSTKPGVIFMGQHHAREHVSREMPLMLLSYLLKNRQEPAVKQLLENRDIWIIPSVNPDGAEYDISTGSYKAWRKNRRDNGGRSFGVDLNRNYGYGWGTGGSSRDTSSDVYMGTAPFSEPETQTIRDFVRSQTNTKVLLSFHTFSELILYPWGGKHDPVENLRDRQTFEKMAQTMAGWNRYKPEQSSDLYIASGDTTDWAYGELGIFAFTFELSPKSSFGTAGFYPGQAILDRVFNDNLRPCMYLLDVAADPYSVLTTRPRGFLQHYVDPAYVAGARWHEALPL